MLETIIAIVQLVLGILALLWYPFEIAYRGILSRKKGIGYWDVDTPLWHKIVIWPIVFMLFLIFTYKIFIE